MARGTVTSPPAALVSLSEDEAPSSLPRCRCVSVTRRVSSCRYEENSRPRCRPLPPLGPALGIMPETRHLGGLTPAQAVAQ